MYVSLDKGNSLICFDILYMLPDQTLIEFAHICNIDLGDSESSRTLNLDIIKNLTLKDRGN